MGALVLPDKPSSPCLDTLDDSDASSSQNTLCCFRSWAFAREALRTLSSSAWPLSVSQPEHRVLHQLLCTLPDLALPPFSQAVQLPYSCPEDPLQPAGLPRLPDLANKNTGHLTKFEFQINKFFFFLSISMPHVIFGHIHTIKLFLVYLKFRFHCVSCILSGNPTFLTEFWLLVFPFLPIRITAKHFFSRLPTERPTHLLRCVPHAPDCYL